MMRGQKPSKSVVALMSDAAWLRKTTLIIVYLLRIVVSTGYSTVITYDPINHGTAVFNEITNLVQWVETEAHSAATELNTLTTAENEILAVARAGDPAQLKALPGISNVEELYAIYGQIQQDYSDIKAVADPAHFEENFNSILAEYKQPQWGGFTAANGTKITPNMGHFQFSTSSYQAASTAQQQMITLDNQKKLLQQQRDAANTSLQSATTTARVDKFHAVINSINGALADVNQSLQQLFNHSQMQTAQNAAAQKVYQAAQAEQQTASSLQSLEQDVMNMPTAGIHQVVAWGAQ